MVTTAWEPLTKGQQKGITKINSLIYLVDFKRKASKWTWFLLCRKRKRVNKKSLTRFMEEFFFFFLILSNPILKEGSIRARICPCFCSRFFSHFVQIFTISAFPPSLAFSTLPFIYYMILGCSIFCINKPRYFQIFFFFFAKGRKYIWNDNSVLTFSDYTMKMSYFLFYFIFYSPGMEFQFTRPNNSVLLQSINKATICNSIIMHFFSHWTNIYWLFRLIFWLKELETLSNI